jgi:hypothetical protein
MKESRMKATSLRTVLIIAIVAIIGLSATGFYFALGFLSSLETKVDNTTTTTIATSNSNDKTNNIIASSKDFKNQITQDINKYASNANISIDNIDFEQSIDATKSLPPISGLQSKHATVTFKNPVVFTNLIQFLKSVENNLPKMQLTGIDITRTTGSNDSVTVKPLTIEFYIR